MKRVGWSAFFQLLLCCTPGCGRVAYELLPNERDASPDAGSPASDGGADGASELDSSVPFDDAGSVPDAAPPTDANPLEMDAAEDAASIRDSAIQDSATDGATPDSAARDSGTDAANDASTAGGLVLRYDFAGTGTVVRDRIGSAHGQVLGGAQLDGNGGLTLDGSNDYVDMPNGLISSMSSVTVVAWLQWSGGPCWQRVFDFGSSDAGEGNAGNATSSFALAASSCPENVLTGLVEFDGSLRAATGVPLDTNSAVQVAMVIDEAGATMTVYANGAQVAQSRLLITLAQLTDVNNWLGRSQWIQDAYLRARLDELRIYNRALTAGEIANVHARGPDLP